MKKKKLLLKNSMLWSVPKIFSFIKSQTQRCTRASPIAKWRMELTRFLKSNMKIKRILQTWKTSQRCSIRNINHNSGCQTSNGISNLTKSYKVPERNSMSNLCILVAILAPDSTWLCPALTEPWHRDRPKLKPLISLPEIFWLSSLAAKTTRGKPIKVRKRGAKCSLPYRRICRKRLKKKRLSSNSWGKRPGISCENDYISGTKPTSFFI